MANYRAIASGNWSAGATWGGGAVPPDAAGHNIYSNGFTVTIDQNVNVALITNAANAGTFVGGGTAAVGGGFACSTTGLTLNLGSIALGNTATSVLTTSGSANPTITANIPAASAVTGSAVVPVFTNSSTGTIIFNGNISGGTNGFPGISGLLNASSGTVNIYGNLTGGTGNTSSAFAYAVNNASASGTIIVNSGTITGCTSTTASNGYGIYNASSGVVTLNNCIVNAAFIPAINNPSTGSVTAINCVFTANNTANAYIAGASSVNRLSGTFINATNGLQAISASKWILFSTPTNAYFQIPLDGVNANSNKKYYTADNNLAQANPTDVRTGVSYASGNLTGRLTVPARGSVALSVNYGPSMPFTATRSGTTATATLSYSYPLVVGDQITVTGASNTEWNSTYTIASVVSGTSVTFIVPDTHSATAGTGATMQTTGTAVLDPAAVASAVWGAASRTITGGLVDTLTNAPSVPSASAIASQVRTELGTELGRIDAAISSRLAPSGTLATVTTLTNAPASVTPAQIRQEMDSNSTKLANLDATVSSRLASSAYSAAPTTAQIATAVEGSLLNEADGQAVLNAIVGAIGNTNLSEVSLVAAVRADLERVGGKIDSIPAAPTAAANATAVWSAATKTITGGTVTTLTNSPSVPSAASIASATRTELTTELGRLDAAVSTRLATSGYTAPTTPPTAAANATAVRTELATELARVDAAVSTRLAGSAYTAPSNSDVTAIKAKTDLLETTRLAQCSTVATTGAQLAAALS